MANGALYAIYGETTSNVFNAAQVIEITVQAKTGAAASFNEIEELTLYIIDQQKKMQEQQSALQIQAQKIEQPEKKMQSTGK